MTTTPADRLDELEGLREAATPGGWSATDERADGGAYIDADPRPTGCPPPWVGHASRHADAVYIAAAHDALPVLVAALRGVLALADELDGNARVRDAEGLLVYPARDRRPMHEHAALIRSAVASALGRGTE